VEIVPYQQRWAVEFREIAGVLRNALGAVALRIDHIGSTAVGGLAAKDIVDCQVSVSALDASVLEPLIALGFTRADDIIDDHCPAGEDAAASEWLKWFFRPPAESRPTNTHVRVLGRRNQRYALLVRDYLRAHPAAASSYSELKRRLARSLRSLADYPDVKDPAVDLIYLAANDWAARTHWEPGPSDA
jgi:GrpB-like predicted nucleotidyltransferase (UPF0157 family)